MTLIAVWCRKKVVKLCVYEDESFTRAYTSSENSHNISTMNLNRLFHFFCYFSLFASVMCKDWTHYTVLDGKEKYHLYWNLPEDKKSGSEIVFKAEVQAKGFVGFGLSPNGGMAGSDIVIGWIKDGKTVFQDRHGVGNALPSKDESQDWNLMGATENDTHTIFMFSRKLDTCDEADMGIDDSTMRVIYAYSDIDPTGDEPMYHLGNRGTKSVMLLQAPPKNRPILNESSLSHWDIRSPDLDISEYSSIYWSKIFQSPQLSETHHIVQVKPLIQEGHEEFVHHMILYECVGQTDEEYAESLDFKGHECYHPNMPHAFQKCEVVTVAWGIGGEGLVFPEHVGILWEPGRRKYYMLEIHYNNPMRRQGIRDKSGLSIYYTPNLRKYNAGCLMAGSPVSPRMFIPPGQQQYEVIGHANPECLGPELPEQGVKVLGIALHSHLLGRGIKVRHFRGSKELAPLALDKRYDFNYQEYRYFKEEIQILLGDQITVECIYNSSGREKTTFGGATTKDEMCRAFLLYYPKIDRYASMSIPTFSEINKVLHTNLTDKESMYSLLNYDWDLNVTEMGNHLRYAQHNTFCYLVNGEKDSVKSLISYPKNLQPFVPEDSPCVEGTQFMNTMNAGVGYSQSLSYYLNLFLAFLVMYTIF